MNSLYSKSGSGEFVPPKLVYFSIFNGELEASQSDKDEAPAPGIDNQHREEDEDLKEQILCYVGFEGREVPDSEKVKRVGITLGLREFSRKFSQGTDAENDNINNNEPDNVNYIDTDKTRIIICELEENYWAMVGIRRGHVKGKTEYYSDRGLAPSEYIVNEIRQGYRIFSINYGSMRYLRKTTGKEALKTRLSMWWKKFLSNKFEFNSNYLINDRGILNLLNGYRRSGSYLPIGFQDNLEIRITELMKKYNENGHKLVDLVIMNTNWVPCKNFGILYQNKDSKIEFNSLVNLINYIEKLDLSFGLSTYLLTMDNLPSLKDYLSYLHRSGSILNDGTLLERSLLKPAKFLHDTISSHFLSPLNTAMDTVTSYIPAIPSVIPSIPQLPGMGLFGLGSRPASTQPLDPVVSRESVISQIQQQQETENSTEDGPGSYLIGLQKASSIGQIDNGESVISYKKIYLKSQETEEYELYNLVVYEINGILYVMIFDDKDDKYLIEKKFYEDLKAELNSIYDLYFNDLIIKQLEELSKVNRLEEPSFYYLIYDTVTKEFRSSLPNIPDDQEIRDLRKSIDPKGSDEDESGEGSTLGLNLSNLYLFPNFLDSSKSHSQKEAKLTRLRNQLILTNYEVIKFFHRFGNSSQSSTNLSILSEEETLLKTSNNWYIYKQMYDEKLVLILKKIDIKKDKSIAKAKLSNRGSTNGKSKNTTNTLDSLGDDVKVWFKLNVKNGII